MSETWCCPKCGKTYESPLPAREVVDLRCPRRAVRSEPPRMRKIAVAL